MRALASGIVAAWLALTVAGCGFDTSGVAISSGIDGRAATGDGGGGGSADARGPDAMPDAMPDAAPCGSDGLACCMTGDACDDTSQCGDGNVCRACGGIFEACCDQGTSCRGVTFCSFGTCI